MNFWVNFLSFRLLGPDFTGWWDLWDYLGVGPPQHFITRWWFLIFFIFTPTRGNDPIWLIFFRWVETTNQINLAQKWTDSIQGCRFVPEKHFRIKAATDDTKPETRVWRLDLQPCDDISYPNISHEEKSTIFHVSWLPKTKMTATKETQKLELTKTTLLKMFGWWFQQFFMFTPISGRFHFDQYFSNRLVQPPTRNVHTPMFFGALVPTYNLLHIRTTNFPPSVPSNVPHRLKRYKKNCSNLQGPNGRWNWEGFLPKK